MCVSTSTNDQCIAQLALILKWKRDTEIEFVASISLCFSRHVNLVSLMRLTGFIDNFMLLLLGYLRRRDVDLHTYIILPFHNPSHNGAVASRAPEVSGHTDLLL